MEPPALYLDARQIDELIASLHRFHAQHGALAGLLDEARERLLLEGFRDFLETFLEDDAHALAQADRLARIYAAEEIPFVLLMGSFNHIKERLILQVAASTDDPMGNYRRIDRRFERAKRQVARHYLVTAARRPLPLPEAAVRDKTLIRIYRQWMERVREAVADARRPFPLEAADDCEFSRAMRYPESLLICLDLKICDQILGQHRLIFKQAGVLYALLAGERYEQAYLVYQELVQKVAQLLNLLSVLYFEGQTNRVGRFFDFLQAALYLPGRKFFCVLNVRALGRLNALYGMEVGDRALALVETALREVFEAHQDWLLYTRGIAGDFYLFALGTTPEAVTAVLAQVEAQVAQAAESLPVPLRLVHRGVELTGLAELSTESLHLVVQYLGERGRRAGSGLLAEPEEAERMCDWIRAHYRRTLDLRAKLTEAATEIFVQPLVRLQRREEIHAFEVLGRFREGEGFLSAGLFIDELVQMGLVTEFDRLVLAAVVRQAAALRALTRRLFVNVSAASLAQATYREALTAALRGPLADFEVVLELTEQTLLESREAVLSLHREHGLVFAIDDFGTGYSSLQTVIELALEGGVRYLKLDGTLTRSLGSHPASERIMGVAQQMAEALSLETVAEYVETPQQLAQLSTLGLALGQGHLLGVPDPVSVWAGKRLAMDADGLGASPFPE